MEQFYRKEKPQSKVIIEFKVFVLHNSIIDKVKWFK
jgi:hypothetical protein